MLTKLITIGIAISWRVVEPVRPACARGKKIGQNGPYCARPVLRAAQHIIGNLLSHRRGIGRHKALLIFMIYVDVV